LKIDPSKMEGFFIGLLSGKHLVVRCDPIQ